VVAAFELFPSTTQITRTPRERTHWDKPEETQIWQRSHSHTPYDNGEQVLVPLPEEAAEPR